MASIFHFQSLLLRSGGCKQKRRTKKVRRFCFHLQGGWVIHDEICDNLNKQKNFKYKRLDEKLKLK